MKVLSHRGYWKAPNEKNSETAFRRSFVMGIGTETDIRDRCGELVVSHDMPDSDAISLEELLKLTNISSDNSDITLALNIKADGLADSLQKIILRYPRVDSFVFDMAVPDMREYFSAGVPVFTRMSEVEQHPVWLDRAAGVWLDGFNSEWYSNKLIESILDMKKRVCVVSPELHGRPHGSLWDLLNKMDHSDLMICTDYPEEAISYFTSELQIEN